MDIADKLVVVTGGAGGIGAAMVRRFAAEGARTIVVADVDAAAAQRVADEVTAAGPTRVVAVGADLSTEAGNVAVIAAAEAEGAIDLLCCNAGIAVGGGVETPDADWYRIWDINVMAHVWAVRAALPAMVARGQGYILTTASAAGLLTNLGAAPYSVTKHAALGLAEWLAITHADDGIIVSCLCPQGVRTRMLFPDLDEASGVASSSGGEEWGADAVRAQGVIEPADVADAVVEAIAAERFLVLPHPEVAEYFQHKAGDHDRWIRGMRKLQARMGA